ncbi:hypothetical protein TRFO_22907 [Tritrichomonas foetus]|uniref:Uncharacterized protein n=1 Tax=Tritrichomonas foetus TaxID=1144522 RepID=A0A1J4KAW8_9EUKA|nr:hypothetical protein TRFO_22907 [Tritrichomonas foetus]|eukprot:OHT08561.1 hypothetical protein TRFO_22907 [Tritrichomonas foetus]
MGQTCDIKYEHLSHLMIFLVFTQFVASQCPIGTHYIYDQEVNATLKKGEWYHFYTNIPKEENIPLIMSVKSSGPCKVYSGSVVDCPNGTEPAFLEVPGGPRYVRGYCYQKFELGMIAIGIQAEADTRVFVRLEGQHKVRSTNKTFYKLIFTFVTMVIIAGFLFFNVILPSDMKKDEEKQKTD